MRKSLGTSISERTQREKEEKAARALGAIEAKLGHTLKEPETNLMLARLRGEGVLDGRDWSQVTRRFRQAVRWLAKGEGSIRREGDHLVLDPDADPRNPNWLSLVRAEKLTGRGLPSWAALWLWQVGCDRDQLFWARVRAVAESLGFPTLAEE